MNETKGNKYKVGDIVYYKSMGRIAEGEIRHVLTPIYYGIMPTKGFVWDSRAEKDLYPTYEEALKECK